MCNRLTADWEKEVIRIAWEFCLGRRNSMGSQTAGSNEEREELVANDLRKSLKKIIELKGGADKWLENGDNSFQLKVPPAMGIIRDSTERKT